MDKAGTAKPIVVSKDYARASDGGNLVLWGRFVGGAAAARSHRLGKDHGEELTLAVSAGSWEVEWLDPATDRTIEQFRRKVDDAGLELEIPKNPQHRILSLQRRS